MDSLTVYTPMPPNMPILMHMNSMMMEFMDDELLTDEMRKKCENFHEELCLDMRINELRSSQMFKYIVPEASWYTVCIWSRDMMNGYYSMGCVQIDTVHLMSAGASHIIEKYRQSLRKDTIIPFEYKLTKDDKNSESLMELLDKLKIMLRLKGYTLARKSKVDPNILNIVT